MHSKEAGFTSKILVVYAFLLFCVYPFYYENGYYNIGIAKNNFLSVILYITFGVMIIAMGFQIRALNKRNSKMWEWKRTSITEKILYIYMLSIVVAFLFSPFKIDVLQGTDGWFLGTVPLLLMTTMSFFVIHMWKEHHWLRYGVMIVSSIIFGLGICNRFSIYPITIEPSNPSFISTLGNINWFCGYMSVIAPIGISLFILQEEHEYKKTITKIMYALYVWIAFVAGLCQGSESVILWNAALFITLLWISVKNIYCIRRWLFSVFLWGMAGQFIKILIFLFPDNYNYDVSFIVESNFTLFVAVAALVFFFGAGYMEKEKKEFPAKVIRGVRIGIVLLIAISLISWLSLFIYNSTVGIDALQGNKLMTFGDSWGNGRGIILKTSFWIYSEMSFWQKIFGVGADGFYFFAYSIPEIKNYLVNYYGESILTNAHCEIFTNIINLGIFGTLAYLGVLFTFIFRCMNKGRNNSLLYIPAVCVICYLANNLVSFAQILNIPYLFLIIGIGEFYLQKEKVL